MIEENGKVVAVQDGVVWVETLRSSACDSCATKAGCGHSALAKLGGKSIHLKAHCSFDVAVGDMVVVGIPEDVMLKSSVLAYLMPLLSMMVFAISADHYGQSDVVTTLAGVAGLALGFLVLRWHFYRNAHDERFQPIVLR